MTREIPHKYNKPIDWTVFENLCNQQLTAEEIAGTFGVSTDTLSRRCMEEKGKSFAELKRIFSSSGKGLLRREMWKDAFDPECQGKTKTLIFLSKQYLGMAEKVEDDRFKELKPLIIETSKGTLELGLKKEEKEDGD